MCPAQAAAKSNETAGASVTQSQDVQLSFPESAHDSGRGSACCRLGTGSRPVDRIVPAALIP